VASEFGVEGFLLLAHLLVSVLLAPSGDCGQAPTEPFAHRPHVNSELPSSAACADVREPEEIEGAGLVPCRFAFPPAFRPNSTSLVFSGCNVRPYLANRFGKTFITFSGSSLHWKHRMASIGESDLVSFPFQLGLHYLLKPFVEDDRHNESPKPSIWTARAADILEKVKRARRTLHKRQSA
jgi:hypothetical protein